MKFYMYSCTRFNIRVFHYHHNPFLLQVLQNRIYHFEVFTYFLFFLVDIVESSFFVTLLICSFQFLVYSVNSAICEIYNSLIISAARKSVSQSPREMHF